MRMLDIIEKKRNGYELSAQEINFFINGYTKDSIPDYQASALMMAIFFQGMTDRECADLTMSMVHSGDVIDLSQITGIKVDKHSTGGVGDTITLILAPLVAALDISVAKMSGRGLGHTGGTIDKLEAIAGFHTELDQRQFIELVNRDNIAVMGQSDNLTPADKKLYALRDVTATVDSLPLIAASIMSKKIAAGADAIVLDVKTGAGAFMKTEQEARRLAQVMVNIGNSVGRRTVAIISDMSQPLGNAIGNALEIKEAIETLQGKGPEDLTTLVMALGSQMVLLAGKANSVQEAQQLLSTAIADGKALAKFRTFIANQGGDPELVDHPEKLPQARYQIAIPAQQAGIISQIVANEMGIAAMQLGAGRVVKEDIIDLAVGIVLHKKVGDRVQKGEFIATIHANSDNLEGIIEKLKSNIIISESVNVPKLIYGVIE